MENQNIERDIKATLKKNWRLFKQSRLGITGLVIVIFFGFLAILQPILFLTNVWDEATYHPVVGYDAEQVTRTVVECPDEYPTREYQTKEDCPRVDEVNIRYLKAFNIQVEVGDLYESNVQPAPPSSRHLLGTDSLGRDIFSQIMEGSQVAFLLGLKITRYFPQFTLWGACPGALIYLGKSWCVRLYFFLNLNLARNRSLAIRVHDKEILIEKVPREGRIPWFDY